MPLTFFRPTKSRRLGTNSRGLSLLEVMFTMVLLVLVITSFAVIYPSGFRLHRKSRMSTEAAQTARSVLNELKNLPLTSEAGELSLAYLATNGVVSSDPVLEGFPRTELPPGYKFADPDGIAVELFDLEGGTDPSVYATLRVTLVYDDPYRGRQEPLKMTLVAGKSWNR